MSIYTEFAEDIRSRQERVARQQAWFLFRRRLRGLWVRAWHPPLDLLLIAVALLVIAIIGAIALIARMF
jgi:hypothetical protein